MAPPGSTWDSEGHYVKDNISYGSYEDPFTKRDELHWDMDK